MARSLICAGFFVLATACGGPARTTGDEYRPRSQTQATDGTGATGPTNQTTTTTTSHTETTPISSTPPPDPEHERTIVEDPMVPTPPPPPGRAFGGGIGSNCGGADTCVGAATMCLSDAYPSGMCSSPCSRFCTDTATSKTFCINDRAGDGGICVAKCTTTADCRPGYKCDTRSRFNESTFQKKVCVPETEPSRDCVSELVNVLPNAAELPAIVDGYTTCNASKPGCVVTQPMSIPTTIKGVKFEKSTDPNATMMTVSCKMAHALVRFADYAKTQKVKKVKWSKAYMCEGTADGAAVGAHGLGEALDIVSVTKSVNGTDTTYEASDYTTALVITDFWMVDFLKSLQKNHVFSNIYTKECHAFTSDAAYLYDDHFHVDLTNSGAPIRDWFTGGHWYLDRKDLRLVQNGTTYSDQEFDVSPGACNILTSQLCEGP